MSCSTPIFSSNFSEERWIKHITLNYTRNLEIPPCVFQVPQSMKDTKPEAYTPQVVGLGPFHHFLPEVQQMESQKRDAVKNYIKRAEFKDFIKLVSEMTEKLPQKMPESGVLENIRNDFESTIRCSYDRFLDFDGKTLSWIIVVDGIFLLHVVNDYLDQKKRKKKVDAQIERLVPDVLMLENQIPLKLLKQVMTALKQSFTEATNIELSDKFNLFCKENSPLKFSEDAQLMEDSIEDHHMLHYLYQLIVGNCDDQKPDASDSSTSRTSSQESIEEPVHQEPESPNEGSPERCSANFICEIARRTVSQVTDVFKQVAALTAAHRAKDVVQRMGDSVDSGYERVLSSGVKVPNNIQKAAKFLQQLKNNSNVYSQTDSPLQKIWVQEIDVPSVSQLDKIAKMKFAPTQGGIESVHMDLDNSTLYLPVITLKANSEVVLRNLVAYEAASAEPGSTFKLTEYVDLMCGIIDTENDVKVLKEEEIIKGDLRDDEIVSIFNGIQKSTKRPGQKSTVQEIVDEVNEKFSKIPIVKAYNSFKKFLDRLQDIIKHLFPVLVLILLTLQYICDIQGCGSRRVGFAAVSWDSTSGNGSSLSLESQANYLMMPRKILRYSS